MAQNGFVQKRGRLVVILMRPADWLSPPLLIRATGIRPGSNSAALAGRHTAHGGAIVACDMHLGLSVPNIWYRAALIWPDAQGHSQQMVGVTLPGTPAVVVGSNGHLAWGFTNVEADTADLVLAVSEAFNNAIRHGTSRAIDPIEFIVEIAEGTATVELRYLGEPFAAGNPELPAAHSSNGRGRYIMAMLLDEVDYRFDAPWTRLRLVKRYRTFPKPTIRGAGE